MIFQPDAVALIRERRKSQTRRPVRRHPRFGFEMPCSYKPGRCYRVQATRRWTVASLAEYRVLCEEQQPTRALAVLAYLTGPVEAEYPRGRAVTTNLTVTVTSVRRERLDDITAEDSRREGFRFPAEFQARWHKLHGSYDPDQQVWVVSFEAGDQRHKFDRDLYMRALPGVTGEDVEEHQDYTDNRHMAFEAEAPVVPPVTLERFAAEGLADHARRNATQLRRQHVRSLAIRLRDAERRGDGDAVRALIPEMQSLAAQLGAAA